MVSAGSGVAKHAGAPRTNELDRTINNRARVGVWQAREEVMAPLVDPHPESGLLEKTAQPIHEPLRLLLGGGSRLLTSR